MYTIDEGIEMARRKKKLRLKKKVMQFLLLVIIVIFVFSVVSILKDNKVSLGVFSKIKEENINISYDNEVKNENKEYAVKIDYLNDDTVQCSIDNETYKRSVIWW